MESELNDILVKRQEFENMSPLDQMRKLFEHNESRLREFAQKIPRRYNLSNKEAILAVIYTEDPHWRLLARVLCPNCDLKKLGEKWGIPFVRGIANWDTIKLVADIIPTLAPILEEDIPEDIYITLICTKGNAGVFPLTLEEPN